MLTLITAINLKSKSVPIVKTNLGLIEGLTKNIGNKQIVEFRGIPYAKPPTGKFRFRKTETIDPWNGILDATSFGPACIQKIPNTDISEDCLALNIYVPGDISFKIRKSVMVWIHGGGFYSSYGSLYNGSSIALYGEVIVVTINYRLGVLGFLSTGNEDLPGNLGLWDQHLALRWIKDNIASFGGNSDSITLFGTSSGGASVSLHSLIPRNTNLFQRVIAQGGLANSYIAFVYDPLFYVEKLGELLGCKNDTNVPYTKVLVSCINETSTEAILTAQEAMPWHRGDRARYELMFGAVLDGDLFTSYPEEMLSDITSKPFQLFRSIDFLAGGTDKEGSMFYDIFSGPLSKTFNFNPMDGLPPDIVGGYLIPGLVKDLFPTCLHKRVLEQAICEKYRGSDDESWANKMLDLYGDLFFNVPVVQWLAVHSKGNVIAHSYQYLFSHHYTSKEDSNLPEWFTEFLSMLQVLAQLFVAYVLVAKITGQNTKIITTPSGQLRSLVTQVNNTTVYQFRNIPYAKPPIDDLRFAKPVDYGPWVGIRDATAYGPACIQGVTGSKRQSISENCLTLNVYVPTNIHGSRTVMVWIHGGGYIKGDAAMFDGSYLAVRGEVVVVTINYRLGVLGFLSTYDKVLPGNNGLLDQQLALKWLQNNIQAFGGNPNSVTIFGESAGGFSVGLQSIIPQNKGLFHRAIAQSGAAPSFVSIAHQPLFFTAAFGETVGCRFTSVNSSTFLKCLKTKTAEQILNAQINASTPASVIPFSFGPVISPVVDGELLPDVPSVLMKNRSSESYKFFRSLDYIAGNVNREGSILIQKYLQNFSQVFHFDPEKGVPNNVVCDVLAPAAVSALFKNIVKNRTTEKKICDEYRDNDPEAEGNKMADLFGDAFFVVPSVEALDIHSDGNNITSTFQYIFNRRNPAMKGNGPYPQWFEGTPHASDNIYLFGIQQLAQRINVSDADLNLSTHVQQYWANFAKTGNPFSNGSMVWPYYDSTRRTYLNLDDVISTKEHVFAERISFWTEELPVL
ncbi:cholinesterase-like [Ylistrum balloti]|uniref:cholinesterase-like n=1 Tax=Ylistrum balloti TaxID=509963 RepID=UPI0029057E40|nr:cholinesterase-like [Ylistrum balloti]